MVFTSLQKAFCNWKTAVRTKFINLLVNSKKVALENNLRIAELESIIFQECKERQGMIITIANLRASYCKSDSNTGSE
jgi:hypothetical protein